MFLRYWNKPEATEAKFIGDWMTTGDQGVSDADGYVHFVGRDDDVITSSGYRIGPGEIEDCLLRHKAVRLAAEATANRCVQRRARRVQTLLREGTRLPEALRGQGEQQCIAWSALDDHLATCANQA